MPKCSYCDKETPVTKFVLIKECPWKFGRFWYFCCWQHLMKWLKKKLGEDKNPPNRKKRSVI